MINSHKSSKSLNYKIMQKNSYSYDELIDCGKGDLFGEGNAKLTSSANANV